MRTKICSYLAILGFMPAGLALAFTPPPSTLEDYLTDFYHAMNGDRWYNRQGWLDPEIDACDWYGVVCATDSAAGYQFVSKLELPDNNLSGDLAESGVIFWVHDGLNLRGNRITGELEALPLRMDEFDLSNNRLGGRLPAEFYEHEEAYALRHLDLSGNDFEGEVPGNWAELITPWLDLSGNRLEGSPLPAFAAVGPFQGYLNLADNRFSGELPTQIMGAPLLKHNQGFTAGGLNLCWNDFEVHARGLDDWLREHHVGGENYTDCLGRDRVAIDATVSGTWFNPSRAGEGIVLQQTVQTDPVRTVPLMFWFTFDDEGRQRWLFETGGPGHFSGEPDPMAWRWDALLQTRGQFSRGFLPPEDEPLQARGTFRFDRTGDKNAQVERVYYTPQPPDTACIDVFPRPPECDVISGSDRFEYVQLSRLGAMDCDDQHPAMAISGTWMASDANGEGVVVEALADGRAVVYWFTYTPDGSGRQAWMMGDGEITDLADPTLDDGEMETRFVVALDLIQPVGDFDGRGFDPDRIENRDWGRLRLEFSDDFSAGRATWQSNFDDYGQGSYALERLVEPNMLLCLSD